MRLNKIDNRQDRLKNAEIEAAKIRDALKIKLPMNLKGLFSEVKNELARLNFEVYFTEKLNNVQKYGPVNSIIIFNDPTDRTKGGYIFINIKYSMKHKLEFLFHEFIHIFDRATPNYSTNVIDENNRFMSQKANMEEIELRTELTTLELMMPYEQLAQELFNCSHDIENIVMKYNKIETSRVVEWIALHDYFDSHYAVLLMRKNEKGKKEPLKLDEYCRINNKFDITNIINNKDSNAYKSIQDEIHVKGKSTIENKSYYCYSFYEKDVKQPLLPNLPKNEEMLTCDKLIIIGWDNDVYEFVKKLEYNEKPKTAAMAQAAGKNPCTPPSATEAFI